MLTLSYRSTARIKSPECEIPKLVSQSAESNRKLGMTGILLFDGFYFMQTLEGSWDPLIELFLRICEDTRHTDVVPFGVSQIDNRKFHDWHMKFVDICETVRLIPDMDEFNFSDERLHQVHSGVLAM